MHFNLDTTVIFLGIILAGLTAGLCFTWNNAVTPGIGQLNDLDFLQAFQQMNRVIINPMFILVFFGPFITNIVTIYLKHQQIDKAFWVFTAAAVIFILGVVFVTIFRNVPLNEILDKTDLLNASAEDLKLLRTKFEKPWNQWHLVRTFSSLFSFALLVLGLMLTNQSS